MGHDVFIFGFADELVKLAQKQDDFWRVKPKVKQIPQTGPRPAPGTRMPPEIYPEKTWIPKPKKPSTKPVIPKAEGYVKGTVVSGLPKSVMKGSPKGIVSAVGERMKFEAANKPKLPEFLSEAMKRPIKGHPMAKAEDIARSKKEDVEASKLVAEYTKKKPGTAVARRGKRVPKPVNEREWLSKRMGQKETAPISKWLYSKLKGTPFAPSEASIKQFREKGTVGAPKPKPEFDLGEKILGSVGKLRKFMEPKQKPSEEWKAKRIPVPGYKVQKSSRPSRFFSDADVSPSGTVIPRKRTI